MEIRLLGPLEVLDNSGATTRITSARQRVIFAALAMQPGQVVSAESLVDCLWGDEPPVTARETVHSHVTRLRKILSATDRVRIVTRAPGYSLDVAPGDVDVFRVRELYKAASECGDQEKAVVLLGEARRLSRGELLADVGSELLRQRHAAAWEEFRVQLTEAWIDAETAAGNHAGMLGELRALVAERPLAEPFRGRLMLALQATGQTAEALREYQEARRALIDGLGVEPGRYLRSIQRQILTAGGEAAEPAPARPAVPAELPHARRGFVGRAPELAELAAVTGDAGIVVVHGMGGIGKTTMAVHGAPGARDRFPDGQLYLDLRGFDRTEAPMRPAEALPRLLHSLGVPPGSVPADVDEQGARLRSLLADRRTLVLLDNAADAEQVRPLLPGGRRCVVLVTSRTRLSSLVAREHAAAVRLGPFRPAESADLLAGYLGPARLRDDRAGVDALAAYCGHVPLALSIVAARALEEPGVSPAELTARLRAGQRLDAFDLTGENLRTVFSWSYRALGPAAARLFRLLAVHPGQTMSEAGVTALAGAEPGKALAELARANLVDRDADGRYRCHDLLRDYAAELAAEDPEGQLARQRVLDWYLHTTIAAEGRLRPHRPPFEPIEPVTAVTPVAFADNQSAMRWCDAEQANLVAAIDGAAANGLHEHAWQLALAVSSYCYAGKRRREWLETSEAGLRSARQLGDPKAEGALLASLGSAHAVNGQYDEAIAYFRQALDLHRATGDDDRAPVTLNSLAVAYAETRRFEPALAAFTQAGQLHRDRGNTLGEALALMNTALANSSLGRLEPATARNREALAVFRRRGDRYHTAICLANLAETYALRGDHRRAVDRYRQAIAQHVLAGNDYGRARTLMNLGRSLARLGEPEQARDCWRRARTVFEELGDPQAEEASALIG